MPLRSESFPPASTVQIMSVSVVDLTLSLIAPSSTRIMFPRLYLGRKLGKGHKDLLSSPSTSRAVSVKSCPSISFTGPSFMIPVRISGPLVSSIMARDIPCSFLMVFTMSIYFCGFVGAVRKVQPSHVHSDSIIFPRFCGCCLRPSVHIIFVLLMFLPPFFKSSYMEICAFGFLPFAQIINLLHHILYTILNTFQETKA